MPLLLREDDVARLLTMPEAMDAVQAAFVAQSAGDGAANHPRARFFLSEGVLHHMAAAYPARGVMGTKTYTSFTGGARFWVLLFSSENGDLLALIEADKLGQMRTGAATGVAARFMAREDATRASLLGSGWQARSQAEAVLVARPAIKVFQVFSRNAERRERFCQEMTRATGIHFASLDSPEKASRSTEIIVCATTAREPVLKGEWLSPGDFVAAVGANRLSAREIDETVVGRADVVVVDDLAQARVEAAELLFAYEKRRFSWEKARPLAEIVAGRIPGRTAPEDITLFKSLGVALEDVAVAAVVYEKAIAGGAGQQI